MLCGARILHDVDHSRNAGAIKTEAVAKVADLPGSVGEFGEGPALAGVGETARLLHDVIAGCHRIVVKVGLQAAPLIHKIIGLTADGTYVRGFGRLLTGRDHGDVG